MPLPRSLWILWIVISGVTASGLQVAAEPPPHVPPNSSKPSPPAPEPAKPWEQGVTPERRALAETLYAEGNELLRRKEYRGAADKYKEALTHWNHPVIQYNLTLTLIELNQPLAAYESVTQALRYGAEGLDPGEYTQAANYEKLLRRQLAEITLRCDEAQSGAVVSLNGERVLTCPGTITRRVLPEEHVIKAVKPGYLDSADSVLLLPGKAETRVIRLYTDAELTQEKRRWRAWIPWTVAGVGVATGAFGLIIHSQAGDSFRSFDRTVAEKCPDGCLDSSPKSPVDQLNQARWQQRIAVGSYAVGGAILAVGAVMVYLNWPYLERIDPNERVTVTPYVTSGSAGLVIGF